MVERTEEATLLESLRAGDERAFARLVDELSGPMRRLARTFVPTAAVAEDVVQETWLAVLEGLDRLEGRSSLKTWIFRILTNRAITRGQRERRSIPFSSLVDAEAAHGESAVDPSRFRPPGSQWAGGWLEPPRSWDPIPEDRLLSKETLGVVSSAIDELPPGQRSVITLRDVEGFGSQDACNVLEISETNQRVLLHRARSRVRRALERYFDDADESAGPERG